MTIEARLKKLERTNRRLSAALAAVVIVAGVAVMSGADSKAEKDFGPFKSVSAQAFFLVNGVGDKLGKFTIENGSPSLILEKTKGNVVSIVASPTGAEITASANQDSQATVRASNGEGVVKMLAEDACGVFSSASGYGSAVIATSPDTPSFLTFFDGDEPVWFEPKPSELPSLEDAALSATEKAQVESIRETLKTRGIEALLPDDRRFAWHGPGREFLEQDMRHAMRVSKHPSYKNAKKTLGLSTDDEIEYSFLSPLDQQQKVTYAKNMIDGKEISEEMIRDFRTDRFLRPILERYLKQKGR